MHVNRHNNGPPIVSPREMTRLLRQALSPEGASQTRTVLAGRAATDLSILLIGRLHARSTSSIAASRFARVSISPQPLAQIATNRISNLRFMRLECPMSHMSASGATTDRPHRQRRALHKPAPPPVLDGTSHRNPRRCNVGIRLLGSPRRSTLRRSLTRPQTCLDVAKESCEMNRVFANRVNLSECKRLASRSQQVSGPPTFRLAAAQRRCRAKKAHIASLSAVQTCPASGVMRATTSASPRQST
jgi:hypothetical protein